MTVLGYPDDLQIQALETAAEARRRAGKRDDDYAILVARDAAEWAEACAVKGASGALDPATGQPVRFGRVHRPAVNDQLRVFEGLTHAYREVLETAQAACLSSLFDQRHRGFWGWRQSSERDVAASRAAFRAAAALYDALGDCE